MTPPHAPLPSPATVAVTMGYGHMRAGLALAQARGVPLLEADKEPFADEAERKTWSRIRRFYESLSRGTGTPLFGGAIAFVLDAITSIPRLSRPGSLRKATWSARTMTSLIEGGFAQELARQLTSSRAPLLTTFYALALAADAAGVEDVTCVVTDSDVNRVWVAADPEKSRVKYAVPTVRAARRLRAYGVPKDRIHRTGFPLPTELLGDTDLGIARSNLAARIRRLDPTGAFAASAPAGAAALLDAIPKNGSHGPPRITFAVGGAGAQREVARRLLHALRASLSAGTLRLTLVAGTREDTSRALHHDVEKAGFASSEDGPVEVLFETTFQAYADRFHARLGTTDVLWTKPSELTFFAALGLPLAFAPPLGVHEAANRRWAVRRGAGFDPGDARGAAAWLAARLEDGSLAAAAWNGFERLPKHGTWKILELAAAQARG